MATAQTLTQQPVNIFPKRRRFRWLRSLMHSPVGLLGMVLVGTALIAALGAPWLAPYDPTEMNIRSRMAPPVWAEEGNPDHPLGTDRLGRDLLSRIIYGAQISLFVGVAGVVVSIAIGVTLGLISGFFGGWIDILISRAVDTFMAIPFIVLVLAVIGVLGTQRSDSMVTLIVVLGLVGWVTFARVVRGEVLSVKNREYVQAAQAIGQLNYVILLRHIFPNVTASVIVLATLQVATVIIAESSLSFLGLGVQPPTITWGTMLADGRDHLATSWWLATFPGVAITLTVLGIILCGDWLRDVLDPRHKA